MNVHFRKCGLIAMPAVCTAVMLFASAILPNALAQTEAAPHPMGRFGRGGLMGAELLSPGKVVTGAPYSAQIVVERFQTFADGNVIRKTSTVNVFRDSQGRTRREMTVGAFGPWTEQDTPQKLIFIFDPVAGSRYVLNPETHVARQTQFRPHERTGRTAGSVREKYANLNTQAESLGTQVIAGLTAQGSRLTRTIPTGQIGNKDPIAIVTERWYSPDLQTDVLRKENNPQSGQTTVQLTNVVRSEPDASLFQVPADYTVKTGKPFVTE